MALPIVQQSLKSIRAINKAALKKQNELYGMPNQSKQLKKPIADPKQYQSKKSSRQYLGYGRNGSFLPEILHNEIESCKVAKNSRLILNEVDSIQGNEVMAKARHIDIHELIVRRQKAQSAAKTNDREMIKPKKLSNNPSILKDDTTIHTPSV